MNKMHFSHKNRASSLKSWPRKLSQKSGKPSSEIGENPMTAAASMAWHGIHLESSKARGSLRVFPAMSTEQTRLLRLTNGRWRERALTIFGAFSLF
jgi:hypothetical protein